MAQAVGGGDAPRVLISVVTWNSRDSVLPCLAALAAQTAPADIMVIDNASSDGCLDLVRAAHPGVQTVALASNTGFCGGHNVALRHALAQGHDVVWLVNDDTRCAPDTLARLLAEMQRHPQASVVSPVIVNETHSGSGASRHVEFCGAALDPRVLRKRKASDSAHALALAADPDLMPVVHGTAILLRRSLIERIGLLNEQLFAYFDDDDLSTRCQRSGAAVRMCADAEVWHDNPVATERGPHYHYLMTRNRWLFWRAFFGGRLGTDRARRLLARTLREAGSLIGRAQPNNARAVLRGLADALRGTTGAPPPAYTFSPLLFKLLTWHPYYLAGLLHADADV